MKKSSSAVQISFLASVAAMLSGCSRHPVNVHLNASGQCVSEATGLPIDQRVCYGYGGGYYGGMHYVYIPGSSAPYYSNPGSPGYVRPWGSSPGASASASSGTVRGVFGSSASGGGEAGGAGE